MENNKSIIIRVDFDYANDTEVRINDNDILLIHHHEDKNVGIERYCHPNGNVKEVADLLEKYNDAYQNGICLYDNPFSEYTSQATYAWEYALSRVTDIENLEEE